MSDAFVAEIRIFGFNFAPRGWATCDGQLLPISQNTALFSLLGTFYGGDGKSNFALPDLRGRGALSQGTGPGLSERFIGESAGEETVTLLDSEMSSHSHGLALSTQAATARQPPGQLLAKASVVGPYGPNNTATTNLAGQAIGPSGSSLPHDNMAPYETLNYCIAMQGIFPPRS